MYVRDKKSKTLDGTGDTGAISRANSITSITRCESHKEEEPAEQLWSDGLVLLLHVILPIAITGAIVGRKAIFSRLWTHLDKSFVSVFCPSFSKREQLTKWLHEYLPNVNGGLTAMWKDGSLMCTLINSVVPGACPNPHRHWRKPPVHGQALAYKYLGVTPVFSELDFRCLKPEERLLVDYVRALRAAVERMAPDADATFSTRYVARGMGLVTGEQHRRAVVYVYPNGEGQPLDDLLVHVRGPFNAYGSAILKGVAFTRGEGGSPPDKRRSFLKSLSADFSNLLKPKERGPPCDIAIRTEFERDRAKLVFVPNNSGVYELCLTTNGEHIAGSPFNLSVERNRSGITESVNDEEVRVRPDSRCVRKKVANTVVHYEKLKKVAAKGQADAQQGDQWSREVDVKETCQITLPAEVETKHKEDIDTESETIPSDQNVPAPLKDEVYTTPLLETLQQLNNLLKSTEKDCEVEQVQNLNNYGLNIIDTMRNIPQLKKESVPDVFEETNKGIDEIDTRDQIKAKEEDVVDEQEVKDIKNICEPDQMASLEDSGTYENDDIDPDSLTSSLELHGSSEEIYSGASGTGSDLVENENEVNNNDILAKSAEDVCYLILNRNTHDRHRRVYSKDFVSCQYEPSKDDLSASDTDLQSTNVSALSADNVREARMCKAAMSSRMFPQHPQEAPRMAATRSYSYSHGNLPESDVEGGGFKRDFLRRKAFWTNLSMSSTSLAETRGHKGGGMPDVGDGRSGVRQHPAVRGAERRSRSSDYARRRRNVEGLGGRYGSADELNFPSVRNRREMYLSGTRRPLPGSAVKSENYSWSIHEKIKSFETAATHVTQEKHPTLPENITVKTKIREGFSKARRYFEHLETRCADKRRHSVNGDDFVSYAVKTKISPHGNTIRGYRTLDPSGGNELTLLFNEWKRKKHMRVPIEELFKR